MADIAIDDKIKARTEPDILEKFDQFFRTYYKSEIANVEGKYPDEKSLVVDFSMLDKYTDLGDTLLTDPEETIKAAQDSLLEQDLSIEEGAKLYVRFRNLPKSQQINVRDIRSEHLEKFLSIEGLIKSASEVRPEAVNVTFECPDCKKEIVIPQFEKKMKMPFMCDDPTCAARGHFKILKVNLMDTQRIKLQEPPETLIGGEQPSEIYIVLTDDLAAPLERKKLMPGNRVVVTGTLKKTPFKTNAGLNTTRYDLYMDTNHVVTVQREFEELELNDEDVEQIKELSKDPNIYERLINSVAPSIQGYREIKEAILFQLFAGVQKTQPDGTKIRGNIHLFLIGDPAVGKSQLLRYVSELAPKGRFVSGKKASGAGLTASVVKDEFAGWTLEAGAMILANNGIVGVDEFDKMNPDDQVAMLEAMEQGTVSIAKAGIVTTLRANTSVLAAANPKYGRFDTFKPLYDQIDLSPVILSRFDLKFPIRDIPESSKDEGLADHVLDSFTDPKTIDPEIPQEMIRKYVAYARNNSHPKMTSEAKALIKEFYVSMRSKYTDETGQVTVAITPRQLEALVRLAEASAKVRLGQEIIAEDAQRAIHLLEYSLTALAIEPETGKIDIDRVDIGVSSAQRGRIYTMLNLIDGLLVEIGKEIPIETIIERAGEQGIEKITAMELINKLKEKGDLYESKSGFIQKV